MITVERHMGLVEDDEGWKVHVFWKVLWHKEDRYDLLERVHEDFPQILLSLLKRKCTYSRLAS